MEENLINPQPIRPAPPIQPEQAVQQQVPLVESFQSIQPINEVEEKKGLSLKISSGKKDFLIGLIFGLVGVVVLSLLDLLFIAMVNPAQEVLISLLIFLGPLVILGLYIFFAIYFFRRRKNIFWGLLVSFFAFIILAIIVIKIV